MNPKLFAGELEFVNRSIGRKLTIPVLSHVMISQRDGVCTLTGTDLEVGCVSAFPGDSTLLNVTAPSSPLLKMIVSLKDKDGFEMATPKGGDKLTVNSGNFQASLEAMSTESFPELPKMPKKKDCWDVPFSALSDVVGAVVHAISDEEPRFTLNGALLIFGDGFIRAVATDGHRLSLAQINTEDVGQGRYLLPRRLLQLLPHLSTDTTVRMGSDENHFFALAKHKNGNYRSLLGRKLTGPFPDYERVMPKEGSFKVVLSANRAALLKLVIMIAKLTEKGLAFSRITVIDNERLSIEGTTGHKAKSDMAVAAQKNPTKSFEIGLNLEYLRDALQAMDCDEVTFSFQDANSASQINGTRGEAKVTEVLMPIRL